MAVFGVPEDLERRRELFGTLPPGWPDISVTSLPEINDLSRPGELSGFVEAAEKMGASSFRLHDLWNGKEMEVRIRRPLPPPDLL